MSENDLTGTPHELAAGILNHFASERTASDARGSFAPPEPLPSNADDAQCKTHDVATGLYVKALLSRPAHTLSREEQIYLARHVSRFLRENP